MLRSKWVIVFTVRAASGIADRSQKSARTLFAILYLVFFEKLVIHFAQAEVVLFLKAVG